MNLRWKIFTLYMTILIIALISTGIYLYDYIDTSYINNVRISNLTQANMISNIVSRFIGTSSYLIEPTLVEYSKQIDSRVIFTDASGKVIVDSAASKELEGQNIKNYADVKEALKGKGSTSVHNFGDNSWAMYVAVPVTVKDKVSGVILISTSIDNIIDLLNSIKFMMIYIFTGIGFLISIISLFIAGYITNPLNRLTNAANIISQGNLDYKVDIKGNDEIGKLAQAFNKMSFNLKKIDEERKQFVSDASHELKTPLASVKALIESLIDSKSTDISLYKEILKDVDSEIDRMTRLVNELLELARMDKINSLKLNEYNLSDIINDVVESLKALSENKKVNIFFENNKDIYANVDADKFYRMIYNIVENGIKYTQPGGNVNINLNTDENNVLITISDDGIGISETTLPNIFDRFSRGDTARSKKSGGFGLGLAIAKEIIDIHEGHVKVESKVGEGTVFKITLPKKQI
ncbi:MAG: ATP-binding protein [Thermoanaerobacteraceae bacterium]